MPAYIVLSIIAAPFTFWLWGASLEVFLGSGTAMPLDVFWAHYISHPVMWVLTIPMGMGAVAIGYLLARFLRGKSVALKTQSR